MKKALSVLAGVILASVIGVTSAQATIMWAEKVVNFSGGDNYNASSDRGVLENALGEPDGDFLSIGLGGVAVFDFGSLFDTSATVVEITYGTRVDYLESLKLWVSATTSEIGASEWTLVGTITNSLETTVDLTGITGGPFRFLKVMDVSERVTGRDGFDIDAIGVNPVAPESSTIPLNPVPEPATMLLFGTGLIGLAGIRRRTKK